MNLDPFLKDAAALTGGQSYKQVFSRARLLISDESRWSQGAYARDRLGRLVKPTDPRASQWDIMGALAKSSNDLGLVPPPIIRMLDAVVLERYGIYKNVEHWSDSAHHEAVLEILDYIIANLPD